ncbi:hypothetical protein BBI11_12975 [Planococcus maritimus]|nr:hypothetical protein BBI11_12975 [Planococcus maritimus]
MTICQVCTQSESYVRFGEEYLCLDCYNEVMAKHLGVSATNYPEGVMIKDGQGGAHQFRLRKRLDPIGIIMDAEEEHDGGYQFREYGELHEDQGELLLRLLDKVKKGMLEVYIEESEFPNGQKYHLLPNDRFVGRVEPSRADRDTPLLSVDGKYYTWEEVGQILMHYEGFQVKVEMVDISEEIEWKKEQRE